MKKAVLGVIVLSLLLFTACGKQTRDINGMPNFSGLDPGAAKNGAVQGHPNYGEGYKNIHKDEKVVDLRNLNGNILFAEIYNMMLYPQDYEGKTIKVVGQYYGEPDPVTDNFYHFVFIADAAACCQQGLEFVAKTGFQTVEDTPPLDEIIEVSGVWNKYQDGENTYYRLNDAEVKVMGNNAETGN